MHARQTERSLLFVVNPAAAGGRVAREWPAVHRLAKQLGIDAPVMMTEAPWHAVELAAAAVADGVDTVVAVGGDGTACEVAEGLHRANGGTLAMVPLGTGNDVARSCGSPTGTADALRTAACGPVRRVDLIAVGSHVVINAIGLGLVADINRRAARYKKIRGIGVYLVTAVASLFFYRSPRVRLESPRQCWQGEISMIAIQNGPTTGGGFKLTPTAVPDDGLLDACLVPGMSALGRAPRLLAGMRGTLGAMSGSVELRTPWLELHHDEPLPIHLDGNQDLLQPPLTRFEVLERALAVAVSGESGS